MLSALLAVAFAVAPPSAAPAPAPASASTWDRAEAAALAAIERANLDSYSAQNGERARTAGLDAAALTRLLDALLDACPAGQCTAVSRTKSVGPLLAALGELGRPADAPILLRLEARGQYAADRALERILARAMAEAVPKAMCTPPSAAEVQAARAELHDFAIVRVRRGAARGEAPTAAELDDLAYFYAAIAHAGPEVGAAVEARPGSPLTPGAADPERDRLAEAMRHAKARGDVAGVARDGHAYLARLGFPGPLDGGAEDVWAWGGARYSYVFRDLALASELQGELDLAEALYRRADPGGGMCGTSTDFRWQDQVRGAIRSAERRGDCRSAVPERLLDIDGAHRWQTLPAGESYGPTRLLAAGFDVPRMLRGAALTAGRDADDLRAALGRTAGPLRDAALARLARRGPEAWDRRVRALEGLAAVAGRAALPVLTAMLPTSRASERPRILAALGALAERPFGDPCDPDSLGVGGLSLSSEWSRPIAPLGDACATVLRLPDAGRLAMSIQPWLEDQDPDTRQAAAEALGKLGHRAAIAPLRARLADTYSPADTKRCEDDGRCHRFFPVRDAAREAIAAIRQHSPTDAGWARAAAQR